MGPDFDVVDFCRKLKSSKNPPYTCPIVECGKSYKSMCGFQYHLVHFDHSAPPPTTPVGPSLSKLNKKKRRNSKSLPSPVEVVSPPPREALTYAESQMIVEFEVNGKLRRVNIKRPIPVISKQGYEEKYGMPPEISSVASAIELSKSQEAIAKLPEPCFQEISDYNIADAPPQPNAYIRFIERSVEELDGEVEYDLDEEDAAWLAIINEQRSANSLPELSVDSFELLMDRLEKESYFQMQSSQIDKPVIDDDAVCCICNDGECQNSNVILFCDMCNLAVHQDCYGVPYIPEGQWLCRRCLQSPSRAVDCVLCPNTGGAFKQTDKGQWAHIVCSLWIPEVRFANTVFLEPIDSIENIPTARWKLTCYICKQRGVGACIQCHKSNCYSAFHVTCAQQAGLYMNMDTVKDTMNEAGPMLVQKTAFCDAHTPADAETRPILPLQQASSEEKMKNARKLLAKKRVSLPVISIPTIPPERIQEIGSLVTLPKKSQLIQRLIAYWTLKRQFRNGVPLLRRLQSSHLSRRDQSRPSAQVVSDLGELNKQLKYWQHLRQDLERARLLCELVRKREKVKKEFVKAKEASLLGTLCPFNLFLHRLLDMVKALDVSEVFTEPVDQNEVPDYGDIVKHPMDLQTMSEKIDDMKYLTVDDFEADFKLMISNCLAYNSKDTMFYRAGIRLREQAEPLIRTAKNDVINLGLDLKTGSFANAKDLTETVSPKVVEKPTPATPAVDENLATEIDKQLAAISESYDSMNHDELMCKLLQLQDRSQNLKHGLARAKRLKLVKIEIQRLRRLMKSTAKRPRSPEVPEVLPFEGKKKRSRKSRDDSLGGTPEVNNSFVSAATPPSTPDRSENNSCVSPSGINRRTAVLFTRKAAAASQLFKKPDIPTPTSGITPTPGRKRGRKSTKNQTLESPEPVPDSFTTYRSSAEMPAETDDDSHSDENESSCSDCSSQDSDDSSSTCSSSDSVECSSTSGELSQLQLVWAKCRGYPWYPALTIDPNMPRDYVHHGVPIPSPPLDVLELEKTHSEPVFLILFFDTKRTWQWLPRNKLELLGIDKEIDIKKLTECRKQADRKAVRKAYEDALEFRSATTAVLADESPS